MGASKVGICINRRDIHRNGQSGAITVSRTWGVPPGHTWGAPSPPIETFLISKIAFHDNHHPEHLRTVAPSCDWEAVRTSRPGMSRRGSCAWERLRGRPWADHSKNRGPGCPRTCRALTCMYVPLNTSECDWESVCKHVDRRILQPCYFVASTQLARVHAMLLRSSGIVCHQCKIETVYATGCPAMYMYRVCTCAFHCVGNADGVECKEGEGRGALGLRWGQRREQDDGGQLVGQVRQINLRREWDGSTAQKEDGQLKSDYFL